MESHEPQGLRKGDSMNKNFMYATSRPVDPTHWYPNYDVFDANGNLVAMRLSEMAQFRLVGWLNRGHYVLKYARQPFDANFKPRFIRKKGI